MTETACATPLAVTAYGGSADVQRLQEKREGVARNKN